MFLAGLAVAVVAALFVGLLQSLGSPDQTARGSANRQQLVAARDLPAGRKLAAQDLAWASVPEGREAGMVSASEALGRALVGPLAKGEALLEANLTSRLSGPAIANLLPSGQRAITVSLRDTGPEVVLYPGAIVDVLATFEIPGRAPNGRESMTRTVLEAVKVLAVNDEAVGSGEAAERRANLRRLAVTLAVTPQQAADLELANSRSTLGIALRSEQDKTGTAAPMATTASVFGIEWARLEAAASQKTEAKPETPEKKPDVEAKKPEAPAQPAPPAKPAPAPAETEPRKQVWEVTVIGGERTQRSSFPVAPKD